MRKIVLTICTFFAVCAICFCQIHTSGGQVYISENGKASYTNPDIYCQPTYHFRTDSWTVLCTVVDPSVDVQEVVEFVIPLMSSEINSYTPDVSSVTETEMLIDCIEQAVIEIIKDYPSNSGITFSQ